MLSRKVSVYTPMHPKCDFLTEESCFFEYTVWLVVKTVDLCIVFLLIDSCAIDSIWHLFRKRPNNILMTNGILPEILKKDGF